MKPAKFEYLRPRGVDEALKALAAGNGDARLLAGGQSLGVLLNLRMIEPKYVIDISQLAELKGIEMSGTAITIGAGVTHAAIEDANLNDAAGRILAKVAVGIAYRTVRNRGTIGGSLAHADPAADWPPVLMALDAKVRLRGPGGRRELPVSEFIRGPLTTALEAGEMVESVRIPRLTKAARWGRAKFEIKPGDFAQSLAAILDDREARRARVVLSGRALSPVRLTGAEEALANARARSPAELAAVMKVAEQDLARVSARADYYDRSLNRVMLERALKEAFA